MVEYKKRLINLKGGGTRNYYTKTYKNGKVVRVKKDEYMAKGGLETNNPLFKDVPIPILLESIIRNFNSDLEEKYEGEKNPPTKKELKKYISGYQPSGFLSSNCFLYDVEFNKKNDDGTNTILDKGEYCIKNLNDEEKDNNRIYENKFFDYANIFIKNKIIAILFTRSAAMEIYETLKDYEKKQIDDRLKNN